MPFKILTVPCLSDNYAFLIADTTTGQAILIDAPESAPVNAALVQQGWDLAHVLITHHHYDHIDGLAGLMGDFQVLGAAADTHRLPPIDRALNAGDDLEIMGLKTQIFDVSGHTIGHLAFYIPKIKAVFTADSLMAMGCGRLFEGTPQQMWQSLQNLRALAQDTMIYSGHEYTASNMAFALSLGENNPALAARAAKVKELRDAGKPTVPSQLAQECKTNPFLRADNPNLQAAVGMQGAAPADVFAEIRQRKDNF